VHRAYALTVSSCTCQYRSSGRTLLDHAVGNASILAGETGDPTLIVADSCPAAVAQASSTPNATSVNKKK